MFYWPIERIIKLENIGETVVRFIKFFVHSIFNNLNLILKSLNDKSWCHDFKSFDEEWSSIIKGVWVSCMNESPLRVFCVVIWKYKLENHFWGFWAIFVYRLQPYNCSRNKIILQNQINSCENQWRICGRSRVEKF